MPQKSTESNASCMIERSGCPEPRAQAVIIQSVYNKKGGGGGSDASLQSAMFDSARVRGGLRCYDAIDRVVEWVITFLVKSSLRVKAEQSQKRQRFCSFVLFSLPVPVQIRIYQPIFVEKKFAELNQTALSVGDFFLVPSGRLVLEDAINFRFFLGSFFKKGSERCVLSDFFTQNYSSPVHWW